MAERKQWIDIYKGLAIILVVLGHLEIPDTLLRFIFSFHMYVFYFIAGVTFSPPNDDKKAILKSIRTLLIPYLFFAFAWDLTSYVMHAYISGSFSFSLIGFIKNIVSVFICGGVFESSASIGPAWFLVSLFIVRIGYILISRCIPSKVWKGLVCVALFCLAYMFNGMEYLPFKIFSSLSTFLFFYLGDMCKPLLSWSESNFKDITIKKVILSIVILGCSIGLQAALVQASDKTLILTSNILPNNPIITVLGGAIGCVSLFITSMLFDHVPLVNKGIALYGKNTLLIMGIHSEIHMLLSLIFEDFIGIEGSKTVLSILIITMALVVPISMFVNKHCPFIVGKRKAT